MANKPDSDFVLQSLRCDFQENPCGIDNETPRLSWQVASGRRGVMLAAWRILVASSQRRLDEDVGDLWDSGRVAEEGASSATYQGEPLASRQDAFWKVQGWDDWTQASGWSQTARFSMGLLKAGDWSAGWIAGSEQNGAVYLRRELFLTHEVVSARLHLCGLGYVEFFIDGRKIGDQVLDPPYTAYDKRIGYRTFEVASLLGPGAHALCAVLGNGFFHLPTPDRFKLEKAPWRLSPRLMAQLEITDSNGVRDFFVTDDTWKLSPGPIVFNCVRGGETIDGRLENPAWYLPGHDDSQALEARSVEAPPGRLEAISIPSIRIVERLAPTQILEPKPGVYLVDFGRNLAGWVRFRARGAMGETITLDYGEVLSPDGTINVGANAGHTHGRYQHQEVILAGRGDEIFEPRFTYHAFRYVEIRGLTYRPEPDDLTACRMHTAMHRTGQFECSQPQLNRLHDAAQRTLEDCTFGNLCSEPAREKLAWNGDTLFVMDAYTSMFDVALLYRKHVRDCQDAQDGNGHVPPVFPTSDWGKLDEAGSREYCDDPWWGGCLADSVRILDAFYGDRALLPGTYESCHRYANYLAQTAPNFIVDWSLGDWVDAAWKWKVGPGLTPVELTSTLGYLRVVRMLAWHARALGFLDEARDHEEWLQKISRAFHHRFFDSKRQRYLAGSQAAPALALAAGAVPQSGEAEIFQSLLDEMEASAGHLTTGFVGTLPLLYTLHTRGREELAYAAVTKPTGSGWYWLLEGDHPTLAETIHPHQSGMGSHHHQFAANIGGYLYRCLAGIRPDPAQPGFRHFFISPPALKELTELRASLETVRGLVAVHWTRRDRKFTAQIAVPPNATCTLEIPPADAASILESDQAVAEAAFVTILPDRDGHARFLLGSGNYSFSFQLTAIPS